MPEPSAVEIWPKATGILDLPEDWASLEVSALRGVEVEWKERREAALGSSELETFTEQLNREWAIETGIIENLYDIERGVTMVLIEQGFSAAVMEHGSVNKEPAHILALLNDQKDALEGLFDFVAQRRPLSAGYIKELHAAMTKSQTTVVARDIGGVETEVPMLHGEWKTQPNYPVRDGQIYRYCPPEHTASEMDRLVAMYLRHERIPPEVEAAWLHHRFTQIHPFQDGNGRVARALASLVLIRAGLFPLVVPRDEKSIYLESLERADEGNLRSLTLLIARREEAAFRRAKDVLERLSK
ncbi:MAG TPA: Fic family protein [Fimbriimonadaceae bacterium]|nr:Fic family protein [Fimbriimonadaceae bacterium]